MIFALWAADITNTDPSLLKSDPAESAQIIVLQARVKELEMEQSLMQHELDNMSEVAQRADKQLRYRVCLYHMFLVVGHCMDVNAYLP